MNATLQRILSSNRVQTASGEERELHSAIELDEGLFLQEIIETARPRNSIEIGCAYGIASLFICEALGKFGARHTIIDPFQNAGWDSIGLLNLERAGYGSMVRFIPEFSHRALSKLEASGERFDFAFMDGQHTFDYVFVDFFFIDQMLEVGGIIVFDDIGYKSIRKVCRYILTNLSYVAVAPIPIPARANWKRRIAQRVAAAAPKGDSIFRPELRLPNEAIGIPTGRYMAIRKVSNNEVRDGTDATRHWTFHKEF